MGDVTERLASTAKWLPSEPAEHRAARLKAWQDHRCCRDCRHWLMDDEEGERVVGCCGAPEWQGVPAAFVTPEDHTCDDFEAKP